MADALFEASRRAALPGPRSCATDELTDIAVAFLRTNFDQRITLRDLEKETGSDSFRIIRAFRRDLGVTPHAFLIELRVARAAQLLLQGEAPAEVAPEVGFVDQSHLTRHFKRAHGKTPRRFLHDRRIADVPPIVDSLG